MLDEAKEVQNNAVRKLLSLVKERETITFKAPTGSGKTHMMADFMNELLSQDSHIVFLVSSLSKGNLAAQNNEKFMEYKEKGSFPFLEPYLINTDITSEENLFIPPSFNVYSLPRDLFKSGGRIEQSNALDSLFLTLQKDGKEIYLIKDECHQDTNNLDTLNKYFSRIINFSATPSSRKGQIPDVEIKEEDAIRSKLIKKIEWLSEDESVEDAINKLEEIKKEA